MKLSNVDATKQDGSQAKPVKKRGLPMRLQLFAVIMGFILVLSAVSFYTSHKFILGDKESSLRELQILKVEQLQSKVESRVEALKGRILESALRLLDTTRTQPELSTDEWSYLVAGTAKWVSPDANLSEVPASAAAGNELLITQSSDREWIYWSESIEVLAGKEKKLVPIQAKFRSSVMFRSIEEFREGALNVALVHREHAKSYDLAWGNAKSVENLIRIDTHDPSIFSKSADRAFRDVDFGSERFYLAWAPVKGTSWTVVSSVEQATLLSGLRALIAEQAFWTLSIIIFAIIVSIAFAKRFSKPIETLVKASLHLETGDFSTRVEPDGPTEMRSLGAAFNHMGQALEDRERALKSAQDALIQNEKLAALGTLSAGIAHEVKNPLAGILGNADLLVSALKNVTGAPKAVQYVETIRKETKRCREIIDSLMRFSRQESTTSEKKEVDLELVAWDSINLVEHSLNMQGFQIVKKFPEDMPTVLGVANQIEQVLLNMLQNAGHAMEASGGKTITVGVEHFNSIAEAPAGPFVALEPGKISGQVARVWIRDEGTGMSPEIQRRIFEPFFTTKEAGKGTGLGLAVTMGILADHEVRLSIDSAVGQGTTFYMDFSGVGPRSAEIQEKVARMKQKAQGGEQSAFDVGHSMPSSHEQTPDLGVVGDDKPIALFEDAPSSAAEFSKEDLPPPEQAPIKRPPRKPPVKPPVADQQTTVMSDVAPIQPQAEKPVEKTVTGFSVRKPKMKG